MIRPTVSTGYAFYLAVSIACTVSVTAVAADLQLDSGATSIYLHLKELQTPASVLHVVAHPDDEDGGMLAYCARELGVRTMLFSLTRGEGGANLISSHFFDELGALRTLEHRKAASYYGIELFYSRAADYGYSKTISEAMQQWQNGVPLLEDLVEVIRRERPTIVLSRFAGDPRDGHGHHQMAGVLSRRAITAAADAGQFPDQLRRGLSPWQVAKFYVRAGSPWRPPKEGDWTVALPTGKYDPVIGMSPAQIARFGLGFQRSQGISGHTGEAGPKFSYYRLVGDARTRVTPDSETSLFDGVDISWSGLIAESGEGRQQHKSKLAELDAALAMALVNWNPRQPNRTRDALIAIRQRVVAMLGQTSPTASVGLNAKEVHHHLSRLDRKLNEAIIKSAGLEIEAWVTDLDGASINHATPGDELKLSVRVANQGQAEAKLSMVEVTWNGGSKQLAISTDRLRGGAVLELTGNFQLPLVTPITRPHWSRTDIAEPLYQISADGQQRAESKFPIRANANLLLGETRLNLLCPIEVRRRDPDFGHVRYPLSVVPDKSIRFSLGKTIVQKGRTAFETSVIVRNTSKRNNNATLRLELPLAWTCQPASRSITFEREDQESTESFLITVPSAADEKAYRIQAVVQSDAGEFRDGFQTVTARDLGRMNLYHDAVQQIQIVDAKVLGNPRVGYIAGSGDKVAESLGPLGITPTMLSSTDLASGELSRFDVILVGVRAYAVREDLRTHNSRLLAYVKRGGVLIIQYQTPEFDYNFGPFPYEMGRGPEEVSEELAEVTILQPQHPLFQTPNVITAKDFDGWFEQRGSKFWKTWDDQYTPLLECHDTAQPPQRGGQLMAQYGNGVYVYSAYAWYRQLPQGVPGAYRLFANLLSLPETELVK